MGLRIHHPRYCVVPKIGMNQAPRSLVRGLVRYLRRKRLDAEDWSLIDAHYFYPYGVAAGLVAQHLKTPYIVTARGSDINVIGEYAKPRQMILSAARNASAIIAVSEALARKMCSMGMDADKIHVLRNGVDLDFFKPADCRPDRTNALETDPKFLSVGSLVPEKGHEFAIRLLNGVPGSSLVIAGQGPDDARLRKISKESGVADRVRFVGALEPEVLRQHYQSADALILMSSREGLPNVVLESIACGTPVLATAVGGIPEILTDDCAGELVHGHGLQALECAWRNLKSRNIDRASVRRHAQKFSWAETIAELHDLMRRVADSGTQPQQSATRS